MIIIQEVQVVGLGVTHRKCIAKHMINHRISADWSTTNPIAAISCTPRVQEIYAKAEEVHLSPGLLGLGVLFNCHALEMYCEEEEATELLPIVKDRENPQVIQQKIDVQW